MSAGLRMPFEYNSNEEFLSKLSSWIGDVFYDIIPEHGYEVREEQIYTAYQLADAVCNKKVHLAEAGLGTGKTFAYLLTAIAYARFTGKPVVIACASTALQEQLAGPEGDIKSLSSVLGLEIDARMAKDPGQYICDARVNGLSTVFEDDVKSNEIYSWLKSTKLGERSEMPQIPDRIWKQISWDESVQCETCSSVGFCKLVRAREHYRSSSDLIIADHNVFFKDLWTREERIDEGKLPILPNYSAVIFDEGHKVVLPAAMSAGQQINKEDIDNIVYTIEQIQGARDSLISAAIDLDQSSTNFFEELFRCEIEDDQSERSALRVDDALLSAAKTFHKALDDLLQELQIEYELYTETVMECVIQIYETQIERAIMALDMFQWDNNKFAISWIDKTDDSFWVVPKNLSKMLNNYLYNKKLPVIFTSATLSNEGDFSYFSRTLGLDKPTTSTVGSPFDIEEQVVVYLSKELSEESDEDRFSQKINQLVNLLRLNSGRALILTNSLEEVRKIRASIKEHVLPFEVLWEDKGDRGYLVRKFREDVSSVLVGSSFWEGIDVPGETLSLVVVWQLPFPSMDPLIEQQRKDVLEEGLNPLTSVDYPEMGIKLKQGCGRLIRTEDDRGVIAIMESVIGTPYEKFVMGGLPTDAVIRTIDTFSQITQL